MLTLPPAESPDFDRRTFLRQGLGLGAALLGLNGLPSSSQAQPPQEGRVRVRAWCEGTAPRSVYPQDIDGAIAEILGQQAGFHVSRSRLEDPSAGLDDAALDATDVLIWWGRLRHDDLPEDRSRAIAERVRAGKLGLVALFGSYASRPFRELMGMPCEPGAWREDARQEHVTIAAPDHPIARNVVPFTIPRGSMFSEPFAVPDPETVILNSTWDTGETFRSGLAWTVVRGRVVYLRHADDAFPVLFHPAVRQLLANASLWAASRATATGPVGGG